MVYHGGRTWFAASLITSGTLSPVLIDHSACAWHYPSSIALLSLHNKPYKLGSIGFATYGKNKTTKK